MNYLDKNGLTHLWEKIKNKIESYKIGTFENFDEGLKSNIMPPADFTEEDITKASNYSSGTGTLTEEEKEKYDLNKDGLVNIADILFMQDLMNAKATTTNPALLEINSKDPLKTLLIKDNEGNEVVNINLTSATLPKLEVPSITVNSRKYGEQKVLWEGAELLGASQIINLSSTPISSQPNGIVLVFSAYDNDAPKEYDYKTVFIPKEIVKLKSGVGYDFWFNTASFGYVGAKYIYFSDTEIKGHANNTSTGTGSTGIKYTNNHWCLRYVIGI